MNPSAMLELLDDPAAIAAATANQQATNDGPPVRPPVIQLQPARAEAALQAGHRTLAEPPPRSPITRSRNGKIARLPRPERDMVNRMLFNNIPHARIVAALDEVDIKVTERNISNWKTRGGYREWCLAQDRALSTQLRHDHLTEVLRRHKASEIPEVGLQAAAEQLSQFFLTPEAAALLADNPKEYDRRLAMLNKIAARLNALQKYRDERCIGNPEWDAHKADEDIERVRKVYSSVPSKDPKHDPTPHHNYLPKPS